MRAGVDLGALRKVADSGSGGYFELEPDLLVAMPTPGFVQTVEAARRSLEVMEQLARDRGRRQALIILIDRVVSQDAGSRRVWREADPRLHIAFALVTESLLGRAIGSFFIGLHKPPVPTRLFDDFDSAAAWARQKVASDGGPL